MIIDGIIGMQQIQSAYSYLNSGKRKERFDIILEPLQAISQLAYLKACPIGTKLTIENNLLFLQMPHWHQGLTRSWNKDKREDILLLFNAVQRFNKIYVNVITDFEKTQTGTTLDTHKQNPASEPQTAQYELYKNLIKLLTQMAIEGLDNLINTYSRIENTSIVQTLVMYKNILSFPDRFSSLEELNEGNANSGKNMETVFAQIKDNWNEYELSILYNSLSLIDKDPANAETYIAGTNTLFTPLHTRIRKWISDNIVY